MCHEWAKEPLVERVEDGEQLLLGSRSAPSGFRLDPVERPELLPALQEGEHEIVLRGEVPVERRLRDTGSGDHFVDTHTPDAATREELVRRLENPVPDGGRRGTGLEASSHPASIARRGTL
jgi:hypothetical protein